MVEAKISQFEIALNRVVKSGVRVIPIEFKNGLHNHLHILTIPKKFQQDHTKL